jgi:hypothetical protein
VGGGGYKEGCRRVNVVEILCTHENGTMRPVETILKMGEGG